MQEVARSEPEVRSEAPPLAAPLEVERVTPYLGFLFLLLSTATLFDGFDSAMVSFAAPTLRHSLGIEISGWGPILSLTRLGVWASFLFLFFSDRIGRRRIMMATIVCFTLANFATGLATTKTQFVVLQFIARLFLTAEFSLAVIMIGEEFPARMRGRAISVLASLATAGVMLTAKVQAWVLLPPDAESNALADLGHGMVSVAGSAFGIQHDGAAWRSLYALGVLPLALIIVLRIGMRETRRFEAVKAAAAAKPKKTWAELGAEIFVPWRREYRRRTAIVTLLWNCVYLVTGASTAYWTIYASTTLKLTPAQMGDIVFWGYAGGMAGAFSASWLIERIGRKYTCAAAYVFASFAIYMLFHVSADLFDQYLWMILTVYGFGAGNSATHVYASELFPTEIRATGYGWTSNFLGRLTEVLVPAVVGFVIGAFGSTIPGAIAVVAIGPVIGAVIVLLYAPETKGLTLEQIAARLKPA